MGTEPPNIEAQRPSQGLSNADILGPSIETLPLSMVDLEYIPPRSIVTLDEALNLAMTLVVGIAWENGKELSSLRWLRQLDDRLPPPSAQDYSVYLVTAPRGHAKYRFAHWSLYSQGHFYHLTATNSDGLHYVDAKFEHLSTNAELRRSIPVSLKVQNVFDANSTEFYPQIPKTEAIALQAYHAGCTRYTPLQIRTIAEYIISQIGPYKVFSKNCQLFALSLTGRIVMTRRDCSVFVGHMHQIAAWDLAGRPGRSAGFYTRATGYVLADPRTEDQLTCRPTLAQLLWLDSWRSIRRNRHAWEIATLYRKGEGARGSYDPEGSRTGLSYIWFRLRKDLDSEQNQEIWEDIRRGRWRDVCYGRLERRKESYLKHERAARKGSRLTRVLLPVYRLSRGVSEEERKAWAAGGGRLGA